MRESRDPGGRLPYRLWYEETEIERICEREVAAAIPSVDLDRPALDIDWFVETRLNLVPEYVWLPSGVLGATEFTADGQVRLQIGSELSIRAERHQDSERLLRSTLAHEAAHVLLHRILFLKESKAIFGGSASRSELCRSIGYTDPSYRGEWWEWQANRGMAALLMPRRAVRLWLRVWERRNPRAKAQARNEEMASAFAVSAVAARRRLAQVRALETRA
ncbi:MAG TPA: hypothetical protein VIA06_22210 [Candidatus Dormibacteraeota bacterium]|nr:hypothetical protein [Candidatus Dormibacteraeota bacterium]